jgi:ferrous iron transport protein B
MINQPVHKTKLKTITAAVAGNPNSGKSTLINAIAGSKLHVGNWPGVTVEKKEASFVYKNHHIKLVDLPGTYSLSPYTQEEIIARDYLINGKPDVIINVVDATNLERNLYLTIQMLELNIPVILALNIYDECHEKGYKIDIKKIEKILGISVIPTIATQKAGLDNLLLELVKDSDEGGFKKPAVQRYNPDIESAVSAIEDKLIKYDSYLNNLVNTRWLALKVIENDQDVMSRFGISNPEEITGNSCNHLKKAHNNDLESLMTDERYALASGLTKEVLTETKVNKIELTERIDKFVLNKYLGIPIFLAAMWLMFKLTFDIANPFVDWIDSVTAGPAVYWIGELFNLMHAPAWLTSLATDGVVAGVGFVLVFVPVIFAMMFFITFLEGSGYMARAAFVMDKAMHGIGLHGKSFIPLLLGFGCNVPSIYATRTLENKKDKILTSLLVPFMSCGARLPVYVVFIAVFFHEHAGLVLWSLYTLGILVAVLTGLVLKKAFFKGESPMFIMELPPYRMPSFRSLMIHTWEKGKHFLTKAGTYILAVSIFVWFLLNLPWGVENKKDSLLGLTGQAVAPVFTPIGFGNWEAASSLITGIIAKEIVVGTMAEIYVHDVETDDTERKLTEDLKEVGLSFVDAAIAAGTNVISTLNIATISAADDGGQDTLKKVISTKFTPLSALSFMVFVLLYMPCIITGVAYKQEFGSWKWYGYALINGFVVAWLFSLLIYNIGMLAGFGV